MTDLEPRRRVSKTYQVRASNPNRFGVVSAIEWDAINRAKAGEDFDVTISEPKRTLDANACMWASLSDFTKHVGWMVTDARGKQEPATTEDVKAILTAAYLKETRMAPGLNGGMVFLSARTSKFSKKTMGEFLQFLHAEGDERGVQWSDKSLEDLAQFAPREK
jgi:phage pi2 protein 07